MTKPLAPWKPTIRVMVVFSIERRFLRARRNRRSIENTTITLIVGFHGARGFVMDRLREVVEEWRRFFQLNRRKSFHRVLGRWFWDLFTGEEVFGKQLACLGELDCGPTRFTDRGVVIVA